MGLSFVRAIRMIRGHKKNSPRGRRMVLDFFFRRECALFGQLPMNSLRDLSKSKTDCMIGGVCGGLGAHTPIPAWVWRAAFLAAVLCFGTGGLFYMILWIAIPDEKPAPPTPPNPPPSDPVA
jgi:phage shock protein PspC (stress-responsive transcriptional regulator)